MPTKKTTGTSVEIIKQTGESVLIEIRDSDGYPSRGYVPSSEIVTDKSGKSKVPADVLESMTPYGLPFEDFVGELPKPDVIAGELRKVGIYTLDDLNTQSQTVVEVLRGFYTVSLGSLRKLAHNYQKKE